MTTVPRIENGVIVSPYPAYSTRACSLYEYIEEKLVQLGHRTCMIEKARKLTSAEFLSLLKRYAAGFQHHGLEAGERVLIYLHGTMDAFITVFAIIAAGGIPVMARSSLTHRELLYLTNDSQANLAVVDDSGADTIRKLREEVHFRKVFVVGGTVGFVWVVGFECMAEKRFRPHEVSQPYDDVLALLYTTGTTGHPKAVEVTHHCYVAFLSSMEALQMCTREDVHLATTPITHMCGFLFPMSAICLGATVILPKPKTCFYNFVSEVNTHKVTLVMTFPQRLLLLLHEFEKAGATVSSVKKLAVCGGPLSKFLVRKLLKVFQLDTLLNVYALSETCGAACIPPIGEIATDNVGFPAPMTEIKIVDRASGNVLGPEKLGEVYIRTPTMMKGYYGKPRETASVLDTEGWLHSGDIGLYDYDGRVCIVDQIKQMIKCLDNQVAPAEVEEILMAVPGVAEVAVVGVPHYLYGEAPTAFVILQDTHKEPGVLTQGQLSKAVSDQCAGYKHLSGGIYFVDSFPKADNGKILRHELMKWGLVARKSKKTQEA